VRDFPAGLNLSRPAPWVKKFWRARLSDSARIGGDCAVRIVRAVERDQWECLHTLILEYADSLGFSLEFQNITSELEQLSTIYGPPRGCALLAMSGGTGCGCVALHHLGPEVCEMKRLYVRPGCRARKVGRLLTEELLLEARGLGYRVMRLDTLESLAPALTLYRSLGFDDIPPYNQNPRPDVRYLERQL
jgi:ribosomal protein S18 acetylase RimI-like enzyme